MAEYSEQGHQKCDSPYSAEDRTKAISRLIKICGSKDGPTVTDGVIPGTRPLRIIFLGKHGAGKSSFVNGIMAALSETAWNEYACTGYRGSGVPISVLTETFEKCHNGHINKFKNVYLPTLIDVAGLMDDKGEKLEEILRLMFYGHIQSDEPVMKVYDDIQDKTIDEIRLQYSKVYSDMRVDRVVFVASAADPLPDKLMASVMKAAKPESSSGLKKTVPVFGVLTKMDKVDPTSSSFLDTKKKFMEGLGLIQPRLLTCKNYCDDLDPEGERVGELNPALDLPYIKFMQKLCNSALKVRVEDEVLPVSKPKMTPEETQQNAENVSWPKMFTWWQSLDRVVQDMILYPGVFIVLLLFLWVFGIIISYHIIFGSFRL